MQLWRVKAARLLALLACASLLALAADRARAQDFLENGGVEVASFPFPCRPLPCPQPCPTPCPEIVPSPTPTPTPTPTPEPMLTPESFGALAGGAFSVSDHKPAYIDSALIGTLVRLRIDSAYDNVRPDRAEFFYAKCGCFRLAGLDPDADGPPLLETRVDYQDIRTYLEYAFCPRFSAFVEIPVRFLNPEVNDNATGLGDMDAGFKYAFYESDNTVATFQLRTYIPTGDSERGLGTHHVSLEPALLVFMRLSEEWHLTGELRDWIPIGGTDFAGNVLRYGLGLSYTMKTSDQCWVSPVVEFVGWTVLDGQELVVRSNDPPLFLVEDAAGDTIVNVKAGVRVGHGNADVYAGYGRALTGDTWYKDIFRVEFRVAF